MDTGPLDQRFLESLNNTPLASRLPQSVLRTLHDPTQSTSAVYLDTLSRLSLDPAFTAPVFICYEPIFLELAARWRKLGSAEQILSAFARLLPVAPYLVEVAEHFLLQRGELATPYTSEYWVRKEKDVETVKEVLLAIFRLLRFRRDAFSGLVDTKGLYTVLESSDRVVKFLAVRILARVLGVAEKVRAEMEASFGVGREGERVEGVWEEREVDYGFLMLLESQRLKKLAEDVEAVRSAPEASIPRHSRVIHPSDWSPMILDMCGVLIPRLLDSVAPQTSIIDTPTTRFNIRALSSSLRDTTPLLITGNTGSGKTTLIHQLASALGALSTMVSVHLGDQTDAKLLIGTYSTAADCPGSFEWRPGVLTTAVREGRWVLVEDIDKAPTDVLGVLLPLIERGELLHPSRGERIKAARGFRLIATVQTSASPGKQGSASITNLLGNRLWSKVDLQMPPLNELEQIVLGRFPLLHTMASSIISVYTSVKQLYASPSFLAISKSTISRHMSPRDVFKWCTRLNILFTDAGVKTNSTTLPESLYDKIFREAVDCFAGNLHTPDAKRLVAERIAEQLNIPFQRLDHFLVGEIPGFKDAERSVTVGRAKLKKRKDPSTALKRRKKSFPAGGSGKKRPFAQTAHALKLMEQVGVAVRLSEPVLLVGETGTGKTTIVQHLADLMGFNLTAINLSQQTESGDLLGGYKPVDIRSLAVPLKETFDPLFSATFSAKKNERFLEMFQKCWTKQQWNKIIKLWLSAADLAEKELSKPEKPETEDGNGQGKKKRKLDGIEKAALQAQWIQFSAGVRTLERQSSQLAKSFAFAFIEGALVKAARNGDWVLLDEINLASPDTLESIADLLTNGSIILSEKGDVERIQAHPDFRIFACMNPATDVGKRDLPPSIRSRFTELYVDNPDTDYENLLAIIAEYIGHLTIGDERAVSDVAKLYMEAKKLAEAHLLVDGASQRPHFSIRTLTRTLSYVIEIASVYGLRRSLYEGFCMSFLTLLDSNSEKILLPIIDKFILGQQKNIRGLMNQIPQRPNDGEQYVPFKHYWMRRGAFEPQEQPHYIITPFVERNMLNLVRATATRKFPVLVQGPTSAGKTSMIEYLAKRTGNKFVRINNHEHTDLQEYMGTYVSDNDGKLSFREGILVEALRNGHWIVLDELNLAPTDVLEALNRLLDDNRELLIPETQEVVRPHKNFMLFATQNPPGLYGGRKNLSRAFRNRFLELHFDDIPDDELETILKERCQIAPSYCMRIVKVYKELSLLRQSTRLFEQKNSFATLRDLFRWANREAVGYQQLAENGYMLLAERVRKDEEKQAVREVLEKVMRVKIDEATLYGFDRLPEYAEYLSKREHGEVVWTTAMTRLFSLVANALRNQEPVLLVGETGCGKTTVCQMLADAVTTKLTIVNAHMNTETGDIIGAQRPKRNRSGHQAELAEDLKAVLNEFSVSADEIQKMDLDGLMKSYASLDEGQMATISEERKNAIKTNMTRIKGLFEWADGPLIQAMKQGSFFLLDEISLADDSVLERLNSVLEPERTMLLAEKGPIESQIKATNGFQFLATMNPGGDYGKKELSPALRNRFTEIWVPAMTRFEDMLQIVHSKLKPGLEYLAEPIVKYAQWFSQEMNLTETAIVSIRDILAWIRFINLYEHDPKLGALHGAALVYFDALGANPSAVLTMSEDVGQQKMKCVEKLSELVQYDLRPLHAEAVEVQATNNSVQIGSFAIPRASVPTKPLSFNLTAPTTALNAMRVIRAMQLSRPILLEGSPGVGKTSLITALAQATGNCLTRINLSEQTDLMDLFGSDVPVEGGQSGEFAWRDAPFLRAMQKGNWVLLDEMNLASQSVLEGLNACLDHRGVAYIAELDREFKCHPDFLVFAAQNPHHQGGGRKGLPASFVNRFTVVYVESLSLEDLRLIAQKLYPTVQQDMVENLIKFVVELDKELTLKRSFGTIGGPWEFNLRDTLRWLELLTADDLLPQNKAPEEFIDIVIKQRFRTPEDRGRVDQLYTTIFGKAPKKRHLWHHLADLSFQVGHSVLPRYGPLQNVSAEGLAILKQQLPALETVMTCIQKNMPCILVGASGSGKSSVLRLLAGIVGAEVDQMALNNDVDTTDIVGGFEQVDMSRKVFTLLNTLERVIRELIIETTRNGQQPKEASFKLIEVCTSSKVQSDIERLTLLRDYLQELEGDVEPLDGFIIQAEELLEEAHKATAARFEWVDGMLVKAVEQGHWLILDNANLCSPSVLDRLNSLLEVGGYLAINEHSTADGDPKVIFPHPNFRFFITMDPKHGELSRAMRNRCVEIYLDPTVVADLPADAINDDTELQRIGNFTDVAESDHDVFRRLFNAAEKLNIVGEDMMWAALEHIPRSSAAMVNRLKSGMDADAPPARILEAFMGLVEHEKVSAVAVEFLKSTHSGLQLSRDFDNAQSLVPLRNTYLSIALPVEDVAAHYIFYTFARAVEEVATIEETIAQKSTTTKLAQMNFIEKSASQMSKFKRSSKAKSSVAPLFEFLSTIRQMLQTDLNQRNKISGTSAMLELTEIWKDMVRVGDASRLDDSVLQVYLWLVQEWRRKEDIAGETRILSKTDQALKILAAPLKLTTGLEMEQMWTKMRPSVPKDLQAWGQWDKLKEAMLRFDGISGETELNNVLMTKKALLGASAALLSENADVAGLVQDILASIEKVEETRIPGLKEYSRIAFLPAFDILLKLRTLSQVHLQDDIIRLAHYAGRPTTNLLGYASEDELVRVSYKQVLEDLWAYPVEKEKGRGALGLLGGKIVKEMLAIGDTAKKTVIGQLRHVGPELDELAKQFVGSTVTIVKNHVETLMEDLWGKIKELLLLLSSPQAREYLLKVFSELENARFASAEVSDSVDFIFNSCAQPPLLRANKAIDEHILPVFQCFQQFASSVNQHEKTYLAGSAWIHYSLACLKLYVPDNAMDPALKPMILKSRFITRREELNTAIEAERQHELIFTGQTDNMKIRHLQGRLEALGQEPADSLIARPEVSEMSQLHGELMGLLQVVNGEPHKRILPMVEQRQQGYADQVKLVQMNLSQVAERLKSVNQVYKDIVDPVLGFVYSLKLGFELATVGAEGASFGAQGEELADPLEDVPLSLSHGTEAQLFSLRIVATKIATEGLNNVGPLVRENMMTVFRKLYQRWKMEIEEAREKAQKDSSLFAFRGETADFDAKEFAAMFPDYEEDDKNDEPEEEKTEQSKVAEHGALAAKIAECHAALFSGPHTLNLGLEAMMSSGVSFWKKALDDEQIQLTKEAMMNFLPPILLALRSTTEWAKGNLDARSYDFYVDGNIAEANRLVNIVHKTLNRVARLSETWPENITLQDAVEICQQILEFPNNTPVAKFITKVEKLHGILHEWQSVASKEFSTAENFDAITQLIISWRKLELTTWPRLFDREDERARQTALSWWFFMFENIVANPLALLKDGQSLSDHAKQLVDGLASFMATSSIGQYQHRLQLIKTFERHVEFLIKDTLKMEVIARALKNFIFYHEQYSAPIEEQLKQGRKRSEKEVADVVLLASWKDTGILALRESAKRSHHKLYKVIRKYRQHLDNSVAPLLSNMPSLDKFSGQSLIAASEVTFNKELTTAIYSKLVKLWERRPQRLRDVEAVGRMMLRASRIDEDKINITEFLDEFSTSIITTIKELQTETPGTLSTENKDAIKHLKTRKRKLLADTLSELRNMGFTSNPSRAVLRKQGTMQDIFVSAKSLDAVEHVVQTEGIQQYFFRLVEGLMKARIASKDHSLDLEKNEVARCSGYLEHLVSFVIEQRASIASTLKEFLALREARDKYCFIANMDDQSLSFIGREIFQVSVFENVTKTMRWLPKMLEFTLKLLRIHEEFAAILLPTEKKMVEQFIATAKELNSKLEQEKFIHPELWLASSKKAVDDSINSLQGIQTWLVQIGNDTPAIAYTFTPILRWISRSGTSDDAGMVDGPAVENTILTLDSLVEKLSDSILVALQGHKAANSSLTTESDPAGWFFTHQTTATSSVRALHMKNVARKINDAIDFAAAVRPLNTTTSQAIRSVFASYSPIIEHYVNICHGILQRSASDHRATTKTAYILCTNAATLFQKGFCQPAEAGEAGGEKSGDLESGTGLGEGEGAEDISKDIGADEDISELAQQQDPQDKDKQDIEDEEDAVNMDHEDMEGEMGDKEGKDDEGEEEEGEEEDKDIDEEVGDVDDLDPDAVDEKMWDAEQDEDLKEKDGSDTKGKQQPGDELEAKKEEQKKKEGGDQGENDTEAPEESEGMDMGDEVKQQNEAEGMDEHVPEVETLDLPEDMQLDGDESGEEKDDDEGDDDIDMDDLSDVDNEDENMKDAEKTQDDDEKFPDLDHAPNPDGPLEEEKEGEEGAEEEDKGEEQGDGVQDDEPPKGDEPMEDPDQLLTTKDEDTSNEADNTAASEEQAVQGGMDTSESNEQASAQQQSGEEVKADNEQQGKGTENAASSEEQNAGAAAKNEQDQNQQQKAQQEEEARKESEFRKVGDILEKWHRQRREILNAKEDNEDRPTADTMELDDPEFEHLPNEDATADTQALGAATEEQAKTLDDQMAIDSGEKEIMDAMEDTETEKPDPDAIPEPIDHKKDEPVGEEVDEPRGAGAVIGETKQLPSDSKHGDEPDLMDLDMEVPDDFDAAEMDATLSQPSTVVSLRTREEARQLWQQHESSTRTLSASLCEHLRLILAPTQATKMRGDFRTGKRLNMRRILPYIASDYKKDKIWLRRAKPSKRQYHVILAVDDSKSMAEGSCSDLALETVALVARALSSLEVGSIAVVSFGESIDVVHPFDKPFTSDSGVESFQRFSFSQIKTDVRRMVEKSLTLFETARNNAVGTQAELWQLEIVISDGVCEDHDTVRRLVRKAMEQRVMLVFVIVDSVRKDSILKLESVKFGADGQIKMERYLDTFPFGYYLVVKDVRELPTVLAGALRQWFAESVDVGGV